MMATPHWAIEMAATFWHEAGEEEPVPRNLRRPIAMALPLTVVLLPRLRLTSIDAWLQEHDIHCRLDLRDRPLHACLVARYGQGIVFLDGCDPDEEQRFSLAHEMAHFLREYRQPRQIAAARLGPTVLEVLDGDRPARQQERIQALLAQVSIGFHIHLMDRTADGQFAGAAIDSAERDADLLAYELLAPEDRVVRALAAVPPDRRRVAAANLLTDTFGLPHWAAMRYVAHLVPHDDRAGSFVRRLGLRP